MSKILKMSNEKAEDVLRQIWSQIGGKLSYIDLNLNDDMLVGNGSIDAMYDRVDDITIGIKELRFDRNRKIDKDDYRNMSVDDYHFMCALVSEFHELSHVGQVKKLIHRSDPSSSYVMIGHMANGGSKAYYEKNYKWMPQEISAQYSGIRNAHEVLTEKLGSEKADALTCMYVNEHINSEFIRRPKNGKYTNVEDIFDAYDKAFAESKTVKRRFDKESIDESIAKFANKRNKPSERPDYLIRYLMVYKNGWAELQDVIDNKTGIEQDMFVARAFVLATDLDHRLRKKFESLKTIDFGPVGIDKMDKTVNHAIDRMRGQYKTSRFITPLDINDTVVELSKDVDTDQLEIY